jgi:uncharacterized protein YkwD
VTEAANADRAAHGLPLLIMNPTASDAPSGAQAHAEWMRNHRWLGHSGNIALGWPGGWQKVGENVGVGPFNGDAKAAIAAIERGFMNSPAHRANILDRSFNRIATGFTTGACPAGVTWVNTPTCAWVTQRFAQY